MNRFIDAYQKSDKIGDELNTSDLFIYDSPTQLQNEINSATVH